MRNKIVGILVCMLLIAATVFIVAVTTNASASNGGGNTLYVGGTGEGNYTKIQDAIDNASDGDTVFVYDDSSPYYENLIVDKSIELIGENRHTTVIDGGGTGYVIDVTTDNVNISGFTVHYGKIGIRLWYTNYDTISNNIISNHTVGVDLAWAHYNLIVDCSLTNCTYLGIALWTTSHHNTYQNCNASYCSAGFHVGWGHYNLVKNCKAWNCTWGIELDSCQYARVENCDVWFNDAGIVIYSFGTARYNTITDCNAYLNGIGIYAYDPSSPGGYNKIYHNNLLNNTGHQARDDQYYPNEWDDGYPSGGNYWSDFDEPSEGARDNNSDGIVDSPYDIPGGSNQDLYPLMHLFGPPYAEFTYNNETSEFNASLSGDYNGYIVSYEWDFGDGTTGNGEITYHKYCDIGTYNVTLTVTDNDGLKGNITKSIEVILANIPPSTPEIYGPNSGRPGVEYEYVFNVTDHDGDELYLWVDWGDGDSTGWMGPYNSGESIKLSHKWNETGTYTIMAKLKDFCDESEWGMLEVTMPRNRAFNFNFLEWLFERFPNTFPILRQLLGLQ